MGVPTGDAPCHKSKKVLQWFETNRIYLVDLLAQLPDLNPIENLWEIIKAEIQKEKPQNMKNLKCKIVET